MCASACFLTKFSRDGLKILKIYRVIFRSITTNMRSKPVYYSCKKHIHRGSDDQRSEIIGVLFPVQHQIQLV